LKMKRVPEDKIEKERRAEWASFRKGGGGRGKKKKGKRGKGVCLIPKELEADRDIG